jgi:hypothetical protein
MVKVNQVGDGGGSNPQTPCDKTSLWRMLAARSTATGSLGCIGRKIKAATMKSKQPGSIPLLTAKYGKRGKQRSGLFTQRLTGQADRLHASASDRGVGQLIIDASKAINEFGFSTTIYYEDKRNSHARADGVVADHYQRN